MTKADIYKAVSDLIYDNSEWIEDKEKKSTRKIDLDMGKVKALRDAGWTLKEIAEEMHVAPSTISNKLKEEGEEE